MSSRRVTKWLRAGAVACFGSAIGLAVVPGVASASTPERAAWWNLSPVSTTPTTTIPGPPQTTVPPTTIPPVTVPPTTLPIRVSAAVAASTSSTLPVPKPPTSVPAATPTTVPQVTPKGELQATFDGHSTTAFAALEYTVRLSIGGERIDPRSIQAILTLTLDTTRSAGTPKLSLCPTTSPWSGGGDQPANKAPHFTSAGGRTSTGIYNSGSHTVTWDVSFPLESRASPGTFSLAVVPSAKLTPADAFVATFDKPDSNSFVLLAWAPAPPKTTVPGPGGSSTTTTFPVVPPTTAPAGGGTKPGAPPGTGSGGGGSSSGFGFKNPSGQGQSSAGSSTASASPAGSPSPTGGGGGGVSSSGQGLPLASVLRRPGGNGLSSQDQRNLAIGLLVAVGVGLAAASARKTRKPRLLVPALAGESQSAR